MRLMCTAITLLGLALPAQAAPGAKTTGPLLQEDAATGLVFVALPAGCFAMGSPEPIRPRVELVWKQLAYSGLVDADERPVHEACVDAFAIGKTEVTAAAWQQVMGSAPPHGHGQEPAAGVTWDAVQMFLDRLNAGLAEPRYRLPTEAEWEYACRAGVKREPPRQFETLIQDAWYVTDERRRDRPAEVSQLPANAWGLHDMLGNVWEWTAEAYRADAYARHALFNPRATETAGERVIRGASFRSEFLQVRCAVRGRYAQNASLPQIGVRLVKNP